MNIKKTFLQLTQYTYPYGTEHLLKKFLPKDVQKDTFGNYYLQIENQRGRCDKIFTSHLDTASEKYQKVQHVFENNLVSAKNSILGADDKAGVTIMLYMIKNKIPGLYYFFIGEEIGLLGSQWVAINKKLNRYNKVISFDRSGVDSVVTHQNRLRTCSDRFGKDLVRELKKYNVNLELDQFGYATDSKSFVELIPECTNISVGYRNPHKHNEYQDLEFLEKLAKAMIKVDWDVLSIKRNVDVKEYRSKVGYTSNANSSSLRNHHIRGDEFCSEISKLVKHNRQLSMFDHMNKPNEEEFVPNFNVQSNNLRNINRNINIKRNIINNSIREEYLNPLKRKIYKLSKKEKRKIKKRYLI